MCNSVQANQDQANQLYEKYLKPKTILRGFFRKKGVEISRVINTEYGYDSEDKIGFVTLHTTTGKTISYQLRFGDHPCFVTFSGFGKTLYNIAYPKDLHPVMYELLRQYGKKASCDFLKGSQI